MPQTCPDCPPVLCVLLTCHPEQRAKRLLYTGDLLSGKVAAEWGLALESHPAAELNVRFEQLLRRVALTPINQLFMHKLVCNRPLIESGLDSNQVLSVLLDGVARHSPEGYEWAVRPQLLS